MQLHSSGSRNFPGGGGVGARNITYKLMHLAAIFLLRFLQERGAIDHDPAWIRYGFMRLYTPTSTTNIVVSLSISLESLVQI